MNETLADRQQRILQRVASGEDWRAAARAEGCSDSYSRVIRTRMKKNPAVAKALEEIRQKGRAMAVYDLTVAMKEAEEVIAFAKQHKHPTAYFFAVRHRAHLSGLLVDRFEVVTVDLTGALARAEQRVLNAADTHSVASTRKPIDWRPHIPGSRIADREGGPADDESEAEAESARRIGK